MQSGYLRESMVLFLEKKGSVCRRRLGQLEEFGKNPGA